MNEAPEGQQPSAENDARLARLVGEALHGHTCGADGEVCCWNEDEITPCSHPDNDLTPIGQAVVDALNAAGVTYVIPPGTRDRSGSVAHARGAR